MKLIREIAELVFVVAAGLGGLVALMFLLGALAHGIPIIWRESFGG
jgi:hypothetical protein